MAKRKRAAKDGKWMKGAFGKHPGKFTAKAKAAGMSVQGYARKVLASPSASTTTKREAALARRAKKTKGFRKKG